MLPDVSVDPCTPGMHEAKQLIHIVLSPLLAPGPKLLPVVYLTSFGDEPDALSRVQALLMPQVVRPVEPGCLHEIARCRYAAA